MPLNILRGLFRGATRRVMTGKMGNKNFYKGKLVLKQELFTLPSPRDSPTASRYSIRGSWRIIRRNWSLQDKKARKSEKCDQFLILNWFVPAIYDQHQADVKYD